MNKKSKPADREQKYYGIHACQELFRVRSRDIIRAYVTEKTMGEFSPLLKWCAAEKKAYHVVTPQELEKVTSSVHHEGVCLLAKERPVLTDRELFQWIKTAPMPQRLMLLDGVGNPHNFGAMIRLAAHFGISFLVGERKALPHTSASAARVAVGGAEHVQLVGVDHMPKLMARLKREGYQLVATSSHASKPYQKVGWGNRVALVVGGEVAGIRKEVMAAADVHVNIPGTGHVESLNVATATAVLLADMQREVF